MEAIQQTIMYFHKGGLVMWPLLFCSIAVIELQLSVFCFTRQKTAVSPLPLSIANFCELTKEKKLFN